MDIGRTRRQRNQRLSLVTNDSRLLILPWFWRMVISLFMHWPLQEPRPHQKLQTDFRSAMGEDDLAKAVAFVTSHHPKTR